MRGIRDDETSMAVGCLSMAESLAGGVAYMVNLDISKKITQGYKVDLFVLHLSFVGLNLLCIFTFGIASLWVMPYQTMTYINAYHGLMKRALETGVVTLEDIGDFDGERYGKQ